MKELQNFVYRHMDALKHHKRYLAMLTALSMLVTFIVPLILVEPADSMTGILVCNKTVHTHNAECYVGDTLVCDIEEHIHTGACYKKISTVSLKGDASGSEYTDYNIPVPNAGGGYNEDTGSYDSEDGNEVDGVTYNPATLPLYTLLFGDGENHWVNPNKSVEENLEIVDDEYFLGFASDFCAFIESDFTATDADAEGRIFIGGDLTFKNDWNYQVGAGDYGQFKSIWNTDEYGHLKGFASGIIGGKVYRLATMTTGAYSSLSHDTSGITHRHVDKKQNDVFLYPEEGAYKRFIVGNLNASLHYDEDYKTRGDGEKIDLPYEKSCNHLYYDQGCTICDTSDKHDYLGEVNELSQFYLYNDVSAILEKTFDTLRARSLSLASVQAIDATINDNGTLSLDASDIGDAKTVYFKINKWDNVKRVVITVPDDRITYTKTGDKEEKYSNGNKTIKNLDLNIIVTCGDEEIKITQNVPTFILAKTANEKPDGDDSGYYGYKISNRGTDDGGNATNNHPVSSNILYNFYNAAKVTFTGDTNFNGTIFAPNASVTAPDACRGHLSGALIAKSFKGGLEFGYRPYRGGTDIFGMASGYAIPVNKFGDDGETALPGALFAIKQDGKFVSLFESGNGTNFAALPSKVDFTGNTPYKPEEVGEGSSERPYVGQEIAGEKLTAPVDFTLYTDRNCSIKIVENSNILPKFYLDANQALNIDANENFKCVEVDSNNHIYEIQLIKPVTSLTITGRNPGESTEVKEVTVNFNPMTLKVNNNECFAGDSVVLTVDNKPQDDGITYKYFLNGSQIDYNDSYQLNTAGGATFSVGAYVNIDGQEYEIANATAEKVNVKDVELEDLSLKLYRKVGVDDNNNPIYEIVSNNAITSGEELQLRVEGETGNATINYSFYNSTLSENNTFSTYGIVGKDLIVKAEITVNGNTKTLQDTVTVNFGDDIKFNDYNTTYEVNPYSNLGFKLENIEKYLNQLPDDKKTITFYFKDEPIQSGSSNYAEIDQKLVGENMSVYAIITANGLEHRIDGKSVTGKYSDNLSLYVESGAFIVGNNINMNVSYAPEGAEVTFKAVDSNNKEIDLTENPKTANGGTCSAVFTPEVAGDYTIKATIIFEGNTPKNLVYPYTITVSPKPVNGNLSVNPSEVYAGNAVELKIHGATIGAEVVFTIIEPNGNQSYPKGQIDQSGEYRTSFTPTLSGEHTIKAIISKDGASIPLETKLTVKENTSTLNGNLSIRSGDVNNPQTVNPGDKVTVNVTNATNGAVLNLTITGPDGKVEPDSVTISNGTYNYEFTPEKVGTYTVTGKLTSGTQERELEKVVFKIMGVITIVAKDEESNSITQFTRGEYVTLSLTEKPDEAVRVDYYLDSLNSSTVMKDISDLQCKDREDAFTVTFKPGQTGKHKYRANAIDANGNVIATVTQEFETVEPTYDVEFKFYNSDDSEITGKVYNAGETVTLRIYGLSKQINNVQGNIPGVAGLSLEKGEETDEYTDYKFVVPNNNCNEKDLVITINLTQGSPIQVEDVITISVPEQKSISLSIRKYLSILAEENLSDNEIEIDVPQGYERISNLKIAFLGDIYEKQSTFKLQAEFTHSDGTTTTQYYDNTNVSGQNPYYLDIPSEHLANNVTKIVITPLEGSITVDKIYPTYIKKENTVVKTSATGFTLIEEDVKVIPVEDWVLALDSITFNLESKKNTNIWYALIEEGKENEASAFSEVRVQNADSISISNLNAENIAQIMVYTEDESLTVKDYTISGFVGDKEYTDEELNELKNNEQHIINYYTLVEQQAPVGYFKEDAIYTIEVDEIIKLNNLAGSCPKEVKTKITVRDKDGNVVLSYTVETIDDGNKRTINIIKTSEEEVEYVDAAFTVTKNNDNEILEVECTNGGVDTSDWSLTKPGGYGAYYFDPEAMMVVPVPTPIKYTNKMGLLFRKIDDNGAAVNGVEIKLYKDGDEVKDNELWYWDENSREHLINFKKLPIKTADNPNPVYKIKETYAGGKYEIADEIYFMRTGEKEVKYWLGSETMPTERTDENQLTVLNFTQNVESRVIRMENIRVVGVKLKLRKTDLETGSKIEGDAENNDYAVFALYANDGTELLNPINVENGEVDIAFDPNTVYDTKYVENGYLKPGAYYLREIKAPNGYETSINDFYFNVVETSDGAYKAEKAEIMSGVTEVKEMQSDGKVHTLTTFKKAALKLISEGIAAETINASTPIIQFKFKTSSGETGWGNAKFKAKVNGTEVSPNTAKYPSGCDVHENGMSFQSTEVTVEFTVQQLCELFDVEVAKFNTINEFVIDTCNSTTVEDIDFWEIENPINSGNNGSGGGEVSENEIYNTTEEYYDEGQEKNETFNVVIVPNGVLDCITDEMITSDATVLSFNIKTSNSTQTEQGWKNYRFAGNFNNQDIVRDKQEVRQETIEQKFTAKRLLEELGITPETESDKLIKQFRMLNSFKIATVNATTVQDIVFYGVVDDTGDDTENNAGNDTENNTENTTPATPALKIERETVIIPNSPLGDTMNLRVDKKWVGDSDVTELRKPVNVALKRKAGVNDSYATFKPENQKEEYITLNSLNDWTYTWKDLPRYENGPTDEGDDVLYYYKVEEITTVTGYTSEVPDVNINEGGIVTITNTLVPVSIDVEKIWNSDGKGNVSAFLPQTLTVKLQAKVSDNPETWQDIPGKILTLTVANKQEGDTEETQTWKGTFENLPKGYDYRIVENVSAVWEVEYKTQDVSTNKETITESFKLENKYNVETGSIAVQKLWQDLTGEATLPYSITVDLYRSVIAPSYTETDAPYTDNANGNGQTVDYKQDYARLLQHSLYFYDANMCGTDVAANSALAWRTNCHTEDEVVGGYHDAGDHAVFGLPQGYAASMLGWTYYEFIKDNTSDTGGKVNSEDARHFKVILERFYDFFVDSVKYSDGKISQILVQKGDGNVDHSYWGTPEKQAERKTTGEDNEMFWSSYGADIASEYAAALAIGYLNFYDSNGSDEHKEKYENYLEVAKKLFEFAENDKRAFNEWGINLDETIKGKPNPGFYESQSYLDDMALAAGWLHLADENGGYKTKFDNISKNGNFWGFSWNDVTLAAYAVGAHIDSNNWSDVASAIDKKIDKNSPDNYFKQDNWGSARYNAIMQTAALVAAKHGQNTETYKKWAVGQMNLLLGGNSWKNTLNGVCDGGTISDTTSPICLVTNFVPDGFTTDTPEAPHHRAASGWESLEEYKVNCGYDDDRYALIGALVGGPAFGNHDDGKQLQMHAYNHDHPLANHTYIDCLHDYCCNEVSLDYNAGLVGAAAGLYYFYDEGARSTKIEGVEFGAYGLTEMTGDIESPTNSAVPEGAQTASIDEAVNEYVLKTFALRQTAVSILGDENTIVFNSTTNADYFNNIIGNGADVESLLFGKNITKIEVSLTQQDACFRLNGQRFLNNSNIPGVGASWNGNTLILIPQEENGVKKFKALWDSDVQNDSITSIKCEQWGGSLNSITVYYEILGFSITNSETKLVEGDVITLKTSGKADNSTVTWTFPNGNTVTGDECNFTAENVTESTNITITATDGTNTAEKTLTINPLAFTENSITIEGFNAEQTLSLNSTRPLTDFSWASSDSTYITVENGIITAKKTTTNPITITATDKNNPEISASIQVSANVPVEALTISGESSTGIGGEITLTKSGGPLEALSYKWTSSDTSIATIDQNGKVIGKAPGEVTITLEAYSNADMTGTVLEFVEKTITIKNVRTLTVHNQGTESDGGNKYFYSLSNLPAGAILKKVTIHVTPTNGQDTAYEGALMLGKEETPPEPWEQMNISGTFSGSGDTITIDNTKDSNNGDKINMDIIDCSKHDFCFGLWSKSCTVNIDWITFEYEMDSTYIEIKYNNGDSDSKTIRKGESVSFTVTPTGGTIGSVQLKNGDTVVETYDNTGSYTITPTNAGDYTIVAAMSEDASKTDSIILTVKDNITINGSEVMDLNSGQTLTVNNAIGIITWGAADGTEHTVDGDGDIIKFTNGATLNTRTGEVKSSSNGGEITITATDSYDGKSSEITIFISEKPKVPELPKKVFLESVTRIPLTEGADKEWKLDIQNLPMTDAKGNPYYYYIQEVGYTQVQGGTEKPLTDSVGHYIYSSDAIYMPVSYYNNGITPVKEGTLNVAKVENKFQSKQEATLPSTGGSGVTTYYYLGGVIMLLSIAGFTGLKRRERKRRKE